MVGRRSATVVAASFFAISFLGVTGHAVAQEVPREKAPPAARSKPAGNVPTQADLRDPAKRQALIDKMIADFDLTPHSLPPIPDNPPPHEGALINLPYVVEPPDLVLVEILEALPGRPISGERLVRPDGTISLGFYGDVQIRGLSIAQIKVAIIKHMRKFISDYQLGLFEIDGDDDTESPPMERPAPPELPGPGRNPFESDQAVEPPKKKTSLQAPSDQVPGKGEAGKAAQSPFGMVEDRPALEPEGTLKIVPPAESTCVYVDVTAYNTKSYYVQGDVGAPGMLPFTGNETVLDVLQYANGLLSIADPKQVTLIRPQRNGKPAKVYKVDLEAIQERGEVATNFQVFPGDRLNVGRNEVVKKTVEIDRLNAPIQSMTGMMLQEAFMLRALQMVSIDHRDELLKEYVDFWAKELSRSTGVKFDEQTLRDAFIRKMKLTPAPVPSNPSSR